MQSTTHNGKQHPTYKNLTVFEDGRAIHSVTKQSYAFQEMKGSLYLSLNIDGKHRRFNVAMMIYTALHGPLPTGKKLYHADSNKKNVRDDNLLALTETDYQEHLFQKLQKDYTCARHLTFKHLVAINDGRVFSLKLNAFIKGYKSDKGYLRLSGIDVHKFIFESFNGLVDSKTFHIDHINNIHDDNSINNLQKLTIAEHNLKTRKDAPQAAIKTGRSLSKPLVRTTFDNSGNIIQQMSFKTVHEAIEQTEKEYPSIKCTKNGLIPRVDKNVSYKGFYWTSQPKEDLPGEEWRPILLPGVSDLKASSKGRIEFCNGRRTFGTDEGKYKSIGHGGKNYPVHFLVCVAFHVQKHPSFIGDTTISVDHINHLEDDNKAENLRWATKQQQSANKKTSLKIVALTKSTGINIKEFDSTKEASDHFLVSQDIVTRLLSGQYKNSKFLPDIVFRKVNRTVEESIPDAMSDVPQSTNVQKKNANQYSKRVITAIRISTGSKIKEFDSVDEIARYFKMNYASAANLVAGVVKKSKILPDIRFESRSD